ncbi:MAG: hypothetical protein QOF51_3145 [Chloroflexota bacterium]|nr:hypothetical protein [Chloroflexota bacterium]
MVRLTLTHALIVLFALAAASVTGTALAESSVAPASQAVLGVNLIVNGDAEAGPGATDDSGIVPPPGWNTTGNFTVVAYGAAGGLPEVTDPGPSDRGQNLFSGGPDNVSSSINQLIDVSTLGATIDESGIRFSLAGYLGGFSSQEDNAMLTASFLGDGGAVLASASIGPATSADRNGTTGMVLRETAGTVPSGTRQVAVELRMTRDSGAYNDGYADNLSLTFAAA